MEISVLTLADYAQDTAGKLTIVGVFDQINANELPCVHSFCLVGRFRFAPDEVILKNIVIRAFYKEDGKELFTVEGDVSRLNVNKGDDSSLNFVLNFNNLQFDKEGTYLIEIKSDNGFSTTMPLKVNLLK